MQIRYRVIRTEEHTGSGELLDADTTFHLMWVGQGGLALQTEGDRYIVDPARGLLAIHSDEHRTSVHLPLPLDLPSILTPLGALRLSTDPLSDLAPVDPPLPGPHSLRGGESWRTWEDMVVAGYPCGWKGWAPEGGSGGETLMLCVSRATPVDPDEYPPLFLPLFQFLHPLFSPAALREIAGMGGFPLRWEESRIAGNRRTQVVKEVVEISKGNLRPERRDPPDYVLKERISYQDLRLASAGPAPPPLGAEEEAIGALLAEFQEGYRKRDPAEVGDWVDRLFSPDASVIGTNSVFPGDFEWRSGRESVMEMISNDWLRWGDLEMYPDDAEISLLGESAWVSMVATVRRDPSQGDRYRWPEDSRRGSLSRIREFTGEALPSVLALYEIIHDASEVLVQYERGAGFLWPIRMTFVLIRTEDGWRIRHMHWSLPGRGFPAVRLFDARSEERPGDL